MNIHPVRAVGVLPEFNAEMCGATSLDYGIDDVHVIDSSRTAAFAVDPFQSCRTASFVSSERASVEGIPLEHAPRLDDHTLDNMIARYFESDADDVRTEVNMVSVNEITFNATPQAVRKQVLIDEMEISLTSGSRPHHDTDARQRAMGCNQTPGRKKSGIKKGKRSRAPARPWTGDEHQRFEESLELFGRNWEQCAAYIGTRRAQLVRSHAQKHLIKLWKLGKPLPKKVAESGTGYTLSGKPLLADSASARSYLTKIPCPDIRERPNGSAE